MPTSFTAIIRLQSPESPAMDSGAQVEPTLELVPGVDAVQYEAADSLVTVSFDSEKTGLGDLVSILQDLGLGVSGIAQRRLHRVA